MTSSEIEKLNEHGMALMELRTDLKNVKENQDKQDKKLDAILAKLDTKADKEEFLYWRNILVAGILVAIALGLWLK